MALTQSRMVCIAFFSIAFGLIGTGCVFLDENGNELTVATEASTHGQTSSALVLDGSPEAVGILNFLNASTTTFDVLDIETRLDVRAARGLIHHRNGPDGEYGTWDDDLFDSIAEADAVKWVGDGAINRILVTAGLLGWIPEGEELLGVYDGVAFSVIEAEIALEYVNKASDEMLDEQLNRRAVNSIVAVRPIHSLEQLAGLRYVGNTAMSTIKEMAGLY